jgi:hypothetical protein
VLSAYPAAAVNTTSATTAAAAPARAERKPRLKPVARTMVSASTNSTNEAVKVAVTSPQVAASTVTPSRCSTCFIER